MDAPGRTIFSIVWSCLSTTFICSWVSVHPNIPPPKHEEYGWRPLARRMWLMIWTLIAPELILLWSLRQWIAAGRIARIYNERNKSEQAETLKRPFFAALGNYIRNWCRGRLNEEELDTAWTRTHGHFVAMGGIILIQPEEGMADRPDDGESAQLAKRKPTETIVDIPMFKELVKDPNFEINITEEEINDKAKGDFLSKSIACLRVFWFITECIARFAQGLGVTQLEVVTLALASLNGIMYFFWSSKPLGLQVPVRIISQRKVISENKGSANGSLLRDLLPEFNTEGEDATSIFFIILVCLFLSPVLVPLAAVYMLFLFVAALGDVMVTDTIPDGATHVPAFYSPKSESDDYSVFIIIPVFGSMFGGLHCLAWNFTYPKHVEKIIWRIASLTIALTPVTCLVLSVIMVLAQKVLLRGGGKMEDTMTKISGSSVVAWTLLIMTLAPIGMYMVARLVLLVEAVALLWRQPANVFQDVVWTKFLPNA